MATPAYSQWSSSDGLLPLMNRSPPLADATISRLTTPAWKRSKRVLLSLPRPTMIADQPIPATATMTAP